MRESEVDYDRSSPAGHRKPRASSSRPAGQGVEAIGVKIGDLNVPVWLVNDALQKKLAEQRDQLKLPDFVGDVHVDNGELVIVEK